jgi:hypothetical protein
MHNSFGYLENVDLPFSIPRHIAGPEELSMPFLLEMELNDASDSTQGRMAGWELWRILLCLSWNWISSGHDLLVLRQYGLLDRVARFSVDRRPHLPSLSIFP